MPRRRRRSDPKRRSFYRRRQYCRRHYSSSRSWRPSPCCRRKKTSAKKRDSNSCFLRVHDVFVAVGEARAVVVMRTGASSVQAAALVGGGDGAGAAGIGRCDRGCSCPVPRGTLRISAPSKQRHNSDAAGGRTNEHAAAWWPRKSSTARANDEDATWLTARPAGGSNCLVNQRCVGDTVSR